MAVDIEQLTAILSKPVNDWTTPDRILIDTAHKEIGRQAVADLMAKVSSDKN